MKVERRDGSQERKVLTALILDDAVAGQVAAKWQKGGLFKGLWANLVGGWCVDYFRRYGRAPRRDVEGLFRSWAEKHAVEEDTVRTVERFLESLSGEYEQESSAVNADYAADLASQHFNRVKIEKLVESLQGDLDAGEVTEAERRITSYTRVEMGVGAGADLFQDKEAWRAAFTEKSDPLVTYPGGLGRFFHGALEREGFIAFLAPNKSGKSFWLLDLAYRAACQRRRVAFFEVGDMSQRQIIRRFGARVARHPFHSTNLDRSWPCSVQYPTKLEVPPAGQVAASVVREARTFDRILDPQIAWKACRKVLRSRIKSEESYLKLCVHPGMSIDALGIQSTLQAWALQGWVADVVIIDYADLLAPPPGYREVRDQINVNWERLRAVAMSLHCLVVTATQSDADSFTKETIDRRNFTDDRRKLDHVTGMVGINVTPAEKSLGLCRLNWVNLRDGEYLPSRCCHVAGCLPLASPAILSAFGDRSAEPKRFDRRAVPSRNGHAPQPSA